MVNKKIDEAVFDVLLEHAFSDVIEEDVKKLKRVNGNASTNSCHCNATTIDISYVRFEDDKIRPRSNYELRLALAQTLHELREAGRCYVKIERKQYCYHITVR